MDSKNSSGTEITIPEQSGMVFGSGRSFGMNEMGGNYEVKTPYRINLFTLSNKPSTGDGLDDKQVREDDNVNNNEALSPPDNDMAAEDMLIYSNDFTESNGQTDKEGTDVDKPAGMETRSKAKAKVAEENKANKQQSKKPSKTEDKQLKAAERKFNEKCIKIQFHVLTSEEFRFEPSKDKCILVMGNKEMGGWKKKDRLMKEKRKIEGFIYEMVYEEMIPTRLVAGGSSIPYKYVIIKQDKPEKEYWDHYMKNYKTGEGYDRDLTVSLKLKSIDVWHQFDCFMEHEPRSLKDKFFDYFLWKKDLIKHAEKAAHAFCPDLTENEKSQLSIDDIVLQLKMLSESMKKIYYLDGKCWSDMKEFLKNMGSYITAAFMKQCNLEELQTSDIREKRERATVSALYFLYVIKTLDLGMPDKKGVRTLSKALLVSVDTEKKECPDLQLVDRHFTGKREALLEAMTSFVRKIAGASKDPCWLSVMPWVHFLSGQCVPFEIPPVDVKHDEYKPVWWGVAEIERDLDYFKGKSEKWSM
ncbi:uncharacterized protein LOC128553236 [Mercenaria mercenaria]|uniref:uncharacterized protein LOC128553236 n=1 Tax=Mercenaria mercenaria TaxID=6596 RepID=UPI00234E75E7|nr:uncharacterized protein LOC128553236 [Mercenaria mercenaria]